MARRLTFVFSALLGGQLGTSSCAGPKFSPEGDCDRAACDAGSVGIEEQAGSGAIGVGGASAAGKSGSAGRAGASGASGGAEAGAGQSGRDASGGTAGNAGGSAGTPSTGGSAGVGGGAGSGGVAGAAAGGGGGMDPAGFPATELLDDFEKPEVFADEWFGSVQNFSVENGVLTCVECPHAALHEQELGADQEVYVTLAGFEANAAEINLILLAQNEICELVEVLYSPAEQVLEVNTCYFGIWELHGSTQAMLAAGDRFGARLHADGTVQVFVNDEERLSASVGALENDDGYIGVSGNTPGPIAFDDFGGGDWR